MPRKMWDKLESIFGDGTNSNMENEKKCKEKKTRRKAFKNKKLSHKSLVALKLSKFQGSESTIFSTKIGSDINSPWVIVIQFCKLCNVNDLSKTLSLCNNLGKPIILMTNFILGGFLTSLITCVSKHG